MAAADFNGTSECTQKRVETCIYYIVQSQKRKHEVSFCHYWQRVSLPPCEGSRGKRGYSLDSWACTEVSICFLALRDKVPSSLLDRQLKGERKLGVRQEITQHTLDI